MPVPASHPYRKHSANARLVTKGLTQAERSHRAAIRGGQEVAIDFAARVHHMTVGLLAECLLRKVVADPAGFNARERLLVAKERSQLDRWKRAVELAFRRHYSIPIHLDISSASATPIVAGQYASLIDLLEHDLAAVIQDRNKIAHGQWAWVLDSKEKAFTGAAPSALNYRQIAVRSDIVRQIAELVEDLVVSEPTFVRDHQQRFAAIQHLRAGLSGADYPAYVARLRSTRR
jgi:hypothetical protein